MFFNIVFVFESRFLLSKSKKTTSMTKFSHDWTLAERRRRVNRESFVEYFWNLSNAILILCVIRLKFCFFSYFDFALKWSNRIIVFVDNTFFLVYRYFAYWIIIRFRANRTSSLMFTNFVDVIISSTIKTLFDFAIINKQIAWNLQVLVQKIVFDQTINLFRVVCFHDQ